MIGLIVLLSLLAILVIRTNKFKHLLLARKLKSNVPSWPIIGHAHLVLRGGKARMNFLYLIGQDAIKQGGLTSILLLYKLTIVVADPVLSEYVLRNCLEKGDIMKFTNEVFGNGVVIAPVPIWKQRRRKVAANFNQIKLHGFVNCFSRHSIELVKKLKLNVGSGPLSLSENIHNSVFDTVFETVFGSNHSHHNLLEPYNNIEKLVTTRMTTFWMHSDLIWKILKARSELMVNKKIVLDRIDQIIESKQKEMKLSHKTQKNENTSKFKSFLDMMLEYEGDDKRFTDEELREEVMGIAMAAIDTTSITLGFAIQMLARHPPVQDKVFAELQDVFQSSLTPMVADDLPKLTYLEAVIIETIRLYPPAPITLRSIQQDLELPTGLMIPRGADVFVHHWAINRHPHYWGDDADLFKPERHLEKKYLHPAQFSSFSLGPRNCLGYRYAMLSLKTSLATILRHYRLLPASSSDLNKPLRLRYDIFMKDIEKATVQIEYRE